MPFCCHMYYAYVISHVLSLKSATSFFILLWLNSFLNVPYETNLNMCRRSINYKKWGHPLCLSLCLCYWAFFIARMLLFCMLYFHLVMSLLCLSLALTVWYLIILVYYYHCRTLHVNLVWSIAACIGVPSVRSIEKWKVSYPVILCRLQLSIHRRCKK